MVVLQQQDPRSCRYLEHLARSDIDDAHTRRDDIDIRPARVDVIHDEKALAIRRNGNGCTAPPVTVVVEVSFQ